MLSTRTTPNGRGLGLIPDSPDHRDHLFVAAPEVSAYKFVDLERDPATPPVWDQEPLGSCTAHGTLAGFLFAAAKTGVQDPMLSRLQLYYNSRKLEGTTNRDAGAEIRDAIKAAAAGVAPEDDWPYDISKFAVEPPSTAVQDASANLAINYKRVTDTVSGIQASLSEGFPVVIGMALFESFESDAAMSSGLVQMPGKTENEIGGHCMAVWGIGHGRDWHAAGQFLGAKLRANTLYVKLRNSWGTGVYQRGYLLTPISNLVEYGADFWTIRQVS